MIVVDTNVIAYLWIPGAHTVHAERVFQGDPEWISPVLWRSEFRNVLAGYIRRKWMAFEVAGQMMEEAEKAMEGREYTVKSEAVFDLVKKSNCSAYDCEFVAVAKDLEVDLITTDKKILSAFPETARALNTYSVGK